MPVMINREILRELRETRLWTQEDLAAASGLSARTIQRIEAQGRCSKDSLQALSAAFNVEAMEFIGDETLGESAPVIINRSWVIGPILGSLGALVGIFTGGWSLITNIQETQADISVVIPALSFLVVMAGFSIGFPAVMTYKYWNTPTGTCVSRSKIN